MDNFKIWCISFCILLVITSSMRFLVPECKMKKVSDSVLSLIVLLVMVVPFTDQSAKSKYNFDFGLQEYSDSASDTIAYETALGKYIKDTLEAEGIACEAVEVSAELDEEGYIAVKSIDVVVTQAQNAENAIEIIKNKCGFDAEKVKID